MLFPAALYLLILTTGDSMPAIYIPFQNLKDCETIRQEFYPHFYDPDKNLKCVKNKKDN